MRLIIVACNNFINMWRRYCEILESRSQCLPQLLLSLCLTFFVHMSKNIEEMEVASVTSVVFKAALGEAKANLAEAIANRDHWNIEIGRLEQLVKSLAASLKQEPPSGATNVGFTDVVVSVLPIIGKGMSATEVRETLLGRGYDVSDYANPLAMIHQSLKRLAKSSRVQEIEPGRYVRSAFYEALRQTKRN